MGYNERGEQHTCTRFMERPTVANGSREQRMRPKTQRAVRAWIRQLALGLVGYGVEELRGYREYAR
jgi:hypothetical protein